MVQDIDVLYPGIIESILCLLVLVSATLSKFTHQFSFKETHLSFKDSFDCYAVLVKILQLVLIVLRMNLTYRNKPVHSGLSTFPALSVSSPCDDLWTLKVTSSYTL